MEEAAIIIGASHAGVSAAAALRQRGWQAPIRLISAECDLPYHRPPLSKAFLAGESEVDQIVLRGSDFYRDQAIDLIRDCRAVAIDPRERRIETTKGTFGFSRLVISTGARARRLNVPGSTLAGILTLRDLPDARRLKEALAREGAIVIVGGGFIGLEVAATAVKQGLSVTVVETQDRLLARALPGRLSEYLGSYHRAKGITFRFAAGVSRFIGENGAVHAVEFTDGTVVPAGLVLVGIGSDADLDLARDAGIDVAGGGVLVDENGATAIPSVYAAGDCASFANRFAGGISRIESVQNANDQARAVAAHCVGVAAPLTAVPWFWSDQYELKLQMAGLLTPGKQEILRGDPQTGAFSILHVREGVLTAAYSVNRPADHMAARKLIAAATVLDTSLAADTDVPLSKAAKAFA